jgi:hypothetical protein
MTTQHSQINEFEKNAYGFGKNDLIIDTTVINGKNNKNRGLVLFMKEYKYFSSNAEKGNNYTCPEISRGNYSSGKAFLSLINITSKTIMQTIKIPGIKYEKSDGKIEEGNVELPIKIRPGNLYPTEHFHSYFIDETPIILNLIDFDGDGKRNEFVIFDAVDCMEIETLLAGYNQDEDKICIYPIHLKVNKKNGIGYWLDRFYIQKSTKRNEWNYTLDYRARGGCQETYLIKYLPKQHEFYGELSENCK